MAFETISMQIDTRGVAAVTLDRPEKHNAMNARMIAELAEAAAVLDGDEKVRAVILKSTGKSFCAGGDLDWMKAQAAADRAGKIEQATALADMLYAWYALSKPVIARVHGNAYGGGLGLVAVCDLAIISQTAKFCLTETKLGLIPATIGPFVVGKLGEGFARQVFFTGKSFGADFALRTGFASTVTSAETLDAAIEDELAAILQCAPGAVADAKALCLQLANGGIAENRLLTPGALADRWELDETQAGIDAFFAKASPPWRTAGG